MGDSSSRACSVVVTPFMRLRSLSLRTRLSRTRKCPILLVAPSFRPSSSALTTQPGIFDQGGSNNNNNNNNTVNHPRPRSSSSLLPSDDPEQSSRPSKTIESWGCRTWSLLSGVVAYPLWRARTIFMQYRPSTSDDGHGKKRSSHR